MSARVWSILVIAGLVVITSVCLAGCGGADVREAGAGTEAEKAAGAASDESTAPKAVEAKKAKAEAAEVKEAAVPGEATPMAVLTYYENGTKMTKDVPYLESGRKIATLETSKGTVKIELWEDRAPNTVVNFVSLANAGRYDDVVFHRVIEGFMAQTGDVEHMGGRGGPGYNIPAEFNSELKHERGVVSMARSSDPNSGGSQFFIMFGSASHLDGKYAAFGKVIEGMDVIDSIKKGEKGKNGAVVDPDKITRLRVESVGGE